MGSVPPDHRGRSVCRRLRRFPNFSGKFVWEVDDTMTERITRADLERRLGAGSTFHAPFVGEISARQAAGVLAVIGVVVAYVVRNRIAGKSHS